MVEESSEYPISVPLPVQQSDTAIKLQLDIDDILTEIYYQLLGVYKDENGDLVRQDGSEEIINEKGARKLLFILNLLLSRTTTLGNLDENDVREITYTCSSNVATLVGRRYKDFNIRKAHFDIIVDTIDSAIYCNLTRAIDSGVVKALTTISRVHEVQQLIQRPDIKKEKKIFGLFKRSNQPIEGIRR